MLAPVSHRKSATSVAMKSLRWSNYDCADDVRLVSVADEGREELPMEAVQLDPLLRV